MNNLKFKILLAVSYILLFTISINAQENNYWNIQYGTRSTLLGGAVIGSVSDLSATYYNPGAIALFPDVKFILSAQVYQLNNYKVKNGAGEGRDLEYSSIVPSPSFVAFNINFDFLGNDRLAVSILTRQNTKVEFSTRIIDSIDVIESSPGKENFAGGLNYNKDFNDVWGGITYSTKISEVFGLGFTGYFAYKTYTNSNQIILEALKTDGDIASYTNIYNYKYNNLRTLLKAGIGINLSPLTIGITVTSPSANIFGSGSVGRHLFVSGIDTNRFESNYQDDVKSEYKTSWSAGFGAAYRLGAFKFHFSAEWYDAVSKFYILDTEPYLSQSSGEFLTDDLTYQAKSITNYGIGVDYYAADSLTFSASFVSDYSSKSDAIQLNQPQTLGINLFHISAGSSFRVWKSELTIGLVYTYGSQPLENKFSIVPGDEGQISQEVELYYSQIKVLLGFEL
ncbi:MAG: hypothetical protein OQK56_06315 [Ignavibacteriaceae bacterium]|nr:hypothetical protein [Ignavibacteriaceae bacterium]